MCSRCYGRFQYRGPPGKCCAKCNRELVVKSKDLTSNDPDLCFMCNPICVVCKQNTVVKSRGKRCGACREKKLKSSRYYRIQMMIRRCRGSSRVRVDGGLEFDESAFDYLISTGGPDFCECCGEALKWTTTVLHDPLAPSIDRIDSSRGYVTGNIGVICWQCNKDKSDLDLVTTARIHSYILNKMTHPGNISDEKLGSYLVRLRSTRDSAAVVQTPGD